MEARYARERQFHDRSFAEGTRRRVGKFYAVTRGSRELYERSLEASCRGKRVLEYGCGPGSQAFFLAERGAHVCGIDISAVAISQATAEARARGLDNVSFHEMNAEALEFPDDSFDLACGTGILHHLDLDRAFAELRRTLRPDGVGIFVEPLGHNPLINLYRRLTPQLRTVDEHPLRAEDLERAGDYFRRVELHPFHLFSLLAVPLRNSRAFPRALALLDSLDRGLFRGVPGSGRYGWQVVLVLSGT